MSRPLLAASLAGVIALLALAGCGGLNTDKLEDVTKDEIAKDVGVTVDTVSCPDDVEAKKGANFICTATAADGSTATIQVEQTDDEGHVEIAAPLLNIANAERSLAQQIGGGTTVDCPDSLIVVEQGKTFACDATDPSGTKAKVQVTFDDDQGNVNFKVVAAS